MATSPSSTRERAVSKDAPAVDLFFVDPAVAVKRRAGLRRGHRRISGQHEHGFYAESPAGRQWLRGECSAATGIQHRAPRPSIRKYIPMAREPAAWKTRRASARRFTGFRKP